MSRLALLALLIPMVAAGSGRPDVPREASCDAAPVERFLSAWGHADAQSIASLFLTDGDLVIPTGQLFLGVDSIREFYRSVFMSGYAGSSADAKIVRARPIAKGICLIDGTWKIIQTTSHGSSQRDESGVFNALLVRVDGDWKISALREQSSADRLEISSHAAQQ